MAKTKFFRIAVEGPTVDGRTIDRAWIDDMAAGYDPRTYTARINLEHIAGFSPEPPFNAYGDVVALRATDVELSIGGKPTTLRALEAQMEVGDNAVRINKAGQKVFTSCEVAPNFAGTGKAGLVGLAMTDTPASLGTERLMFSAKVRGAELTEAHETTLEFEAAEPAQDSEVTSLAKGIAAFFKGFGKTDEEKPAPPPPLPSTPNPANDNFTAFAAEVGKLAGAVEALSGKVDGFDTRFKAIETRTADLVTSIQTTDRSNHHRTPATGGNGAVQTDC